MLSRLFFALYLFFTIPISTFAQLTIKGAVTDERGEGLPNANITIVGTTSGMKSSSPAFPLQPAKSNWEMPFPP